jgi:TetR/AcrR family transcriptional regulator, transcriptional repressor for nem operon
MFRNIFSSPVFSHPMESSMPYPAEHHHLTKHKIIRSARRRFNRHGFDAVSIDDVMADAGLTRGSFYTYFESKGDLYAEAVTDVLTEKQLLSSDGVSIDSRAVNNAAQFIRDYLSLEHFEDIDGSCPLIGFPSQVLQKEPRVRQAFETVLKVMIDVFEQALQRNGQTARNRARAIAALCVGGMVLARSMEDRTLADELREAAMDVALSLGPWPCTTSDKRDISRHPEVRRATSTAGADARRADEVIE